MIEFFIKIVEKFSLNQVECQLHRNPDDNLHWMYEWLNILLKIEHWWHMCWFYSILISGYIYSIKHFTKAGIYYVQYTENNGKKSWKVYKLHLNHLNIFLNLWIHHINLFKVPFLIHCQWMLPQPSIYCNYLIVPWFSAC